MIDIMNSYLVLKYEKNSDALNKLLGIQKTTQLNDKNLSTKNY